MKPYVLYTLLRALIGVVAIIFAGTLIIHPSMFKWLQENPVWDGIFTAAACVFHVWNTYRPPRMSMV